VPPAAQASAPIAPALAAATIDELRRHAPFDRMEQACLEWLVARLSVVYFAPEAVVLEPGSAAPDYLFIVKQGGVLGFDPEHKGVGKPRFRMSVGECFPLGALMAQRSVTSAYRAAGDTFCFRLPAAEFRELLKLSVPFQEFATQRLGNLLALSRRSAHIDQAVSLSRQPLDRPIGELLKRPAVSCAAGTSLRAALEAMQRERVGSILVTAADGRPVGIFTLRDLRDRVALSGYGVDEPIDCVMTANPITLPLSSMAFDAALTMTRHGFHHVVVTENERAVGIVSESDLFALQRVGLTALSAGIRSADSLAKLVAVSSEVRLLVRTLLAQGVPAEQLTRIISTLNDLLTLRVIELEARAAGVGHNEFCWLALGSEGRHEQTLATDQDNGVLFPDPPDAQPQAVRDRLLPFARRVNEALAGCGFPLCKGEIMGGNPRWCLSLSEWKRQFSTWMSEPNGEALLNSTIFFDFRALHGATALADELRQWLSDTTKSRDLFRRFMAENALRNEPPLGLVRDFAVSDHEGRPGTLDLKVNGAALFVDAARVLSLAVGDGHTSTVERLRAVAHVRGLSPGEMEAWVDAFHFIQSVRMTHQQAQLEAGTSADNYLKPDELNALDRRILKEAFRQARKLQERLRLDYRL
jgi:CBS domain-containing protein